MIERREVEGKAAPYNPLSFESSVVNGDGPVDIASAQTRRFQQRQMRMFHFDPLVPKRCDEARSRDRKSVLFRQNEISKRDSLIGPLDGCVVDAPSLLRIEVAPRKGADSD